jgi:hypothetical protein
MDNDYRDKWVRLARIDETTSGEPATDVDREHVGCVGRASSIYNDGRPSHDEGYIVKFADGYEGQYIADELELVGQLRN